MKPQYVSTYADYLIKYLDAYAAKGVPVCGLLRLMNPMAITASGRVCIQEEGWFDDDSFWWNENATDWAYTATWAPNPEDHPIYTPVHRYARNIIVSLNHWMTGWIDWNIDWTERLRRGI